MEWSVTSAEMSAVSAKCQEYALLWIHRDWLLFAIPNDMGRKLAFLTCKFPENGSNHDLHAMGVAFINAFYMQFLYERYMNPTPNNIEAIRLYIKRSFIERAQSPVDVKITPSILEYLEGYLDPILFPHNLRVLFGEV